MHTLTLEQNFFSFSNKAPALSPNSRLPGHGHRMENIPQRLLVEKIRDRGKGPKTRTARMAEM